MNKVIRTSRVGERSYTLDAYTMKENASTYPYYLFRYELKRALIDSKNFSLLTARVIYLYDYNGETRQLRATLSQGKTQRGKKFLQIGCKRFIGENRTRLIRWANSYKS